MNSPDPGFDKQQLHELASSVFDGITTEGQLRELTEIMRESPSARDEYLKLVDLHATLATDIATASSAKQHVAAKPLAMPRRRWIPLASTIVALSACLLIAVKWFGANSPDDRPGTFATVAQATEVVWDSDQFVVGNRVGPATMQLKSGLVRLEFDSGVEVTLEGPCIFKLGDITNTELKRGLLTATVPPGAEGFTVETPSAQVIDLGTSFGIDLTNDGFSNVSVFDGEVEVAALRPSESDAAERILLSEGDSVRIGTDYEIEEIEFDSKPFEKMWPFASGIAGSTDTISFVPPWPRKLRYVKSDEQIFVRPEGHPTQLETGLKVNISMPGDCVEIVDLSPAILQENEAVRSYVLHFSPETQLVERRARRVTGSITFDRPVLGLIVLHDELLASSGLFGRRRAGEAQQRRELNLTGDEGGDRVTLSQDRKTVTLDLISPRKTSDLIRIIVEGSGGFRGLARRNRN